jgi:iron complex outermembrane recepter protein
LQHRFALGTRQDIVWGVGYRYLTEDITNRDFFVTFTPSSGDANNFSARSCRTTSRSSKSLHLTIGSKFEHNDFTGFEVEPSVRLAWTPTEKQTVWAAVSRAVRTPADLERDIFQKIRSFSPPVHARFGLWKSESQIRGIDRLRTGLPDQARRATVVRRRHLLQRL